MTALRTLILAGSFTEAARYARGKSLRSYRYAVNATAVGGYQAQDIVELPGYESRRDKFAIQSAIRNLTRRGVTVRKDSYTAPPPPPAPQYGEPGYIADLLLGDVPAGEAFRELEQFSERTLREVGATEAEVKVFADIDQAAEKIQGAIEATANLTKADFVESSPAQPAKRIGRPPGSKNKPRVNAPKNPGSVQNNVSGRDSESEPKATNSVDDLFEE